MKRSQFLTISALSLPTLLSANVREEAGSLDAWARNYGAQVRSENEVIAITLRTRPQQHAEALHALDTLSTGPIHCQGSELTGNIDQKRFRLRFA